MGATVALVGASSWKSAKPAGYKNGDLDKAIAAYEAAFAKIKNLKAPIKLIQNSPKAKVTEMDKCIAELKTAITEYESCKDLINAVISAAKTVQSAGSKTAADLTKLSKGKDVDEEAYLAGAAEARAQAGAAGCDITNLS
jgi:hypothetical protein